MDFNGSHEFAASQKQVYAAFFNSDTLAAAIPGCKQAKWIDSQTLELIADISLPMIKGTYAGRLQATEQQEPSHFKLNLQQRQVRGSASIDLSEVNGKTLVTYKGEADLNGPYKVADNMIGAQAAKLMLGQFMKQLEKHISS